MKEQAYVKDGTLVLELGAMSGNNGPSCSVSPDDQ